MATITTLQGTDAITTADSMAKINTNFSNLNSDKIETSYLDTDTTLAANSDSKIPTQKAVKAYVDAGGNVNASEVTKGIVEEATDAEVTAGTATGATGAKLFVTPAKLATNLASITSNFGDGSDGDVTISSPTTLTKDMYYNNLVVTDTLTTNGFRIFVKETISGAGKIANNGNAGSNASGGTGGAGGTTHTGYFVNTAGATGPSGGSAGPATNGVNGTSPTNALHVNVAGNGGKGGRGDSGSGSTILGGTGGTGVITNQLIGKLNLNTIHLITLSGGVMTQYKVGGSGASGATGEDTNGAAYQQGGGGGGGATGGLIFVCAKNWTGTFTYEAKGGNGGNGGNAVANAGGGGGGGGGTGGIALTIYKTKTWTGSYTLTGGSGGAKGSPAGIGVDDAAAGTAGNVGASFEIQYSNLIP